VTSLLHRHDVTANREGESGRLETVLRDDPGVEAGRRLLLQLSAVVPPSCSGYWAHHRRFDAGAGWGIGGSCPTEVPLSAVCSVL